MGFNGTHAAWSHRISDKVLARIEQVQDGTMSDHPNARAPVTYRIEYLDGRGLVTGAAR